MDFCMTLSKFLFSVCVKLNGVVYFLKSHSCVKQKTNTNNKKLLEYKFIFLLNKIIISKFCTNLLQEVFIFTFIHLFY